jgi:proline dehydrogenase
VNLFDQAVVGLLPLVPRPIVRRFSARYIAGDDIDAAVRTIRSLNDRRIMATVDVLGEFIHGLDQADATAAEYERVLGRIGEGGLDANISIKLTALGLLLDEAHCRRLVERLVTAAAARGNFVRIDMEDSACTTRTLDLYRRLRERHDNVGVVLQAYMRRSLADIEALLPLRPSVRVCKGIYVEPESVAFREPEAIRKNYVDMVDRLFDAGCYVGLATHDELLVERCLATIRRRKLPREAYEFQMLLGVTEALRGRLVDAGHRLRVYVPYGAEWYAYSVRRLKENPKIAGYVFQNLLAGRNGR